MLYKTVLIVKLRSQSFYTLNVVTVILLYLYCTCCMNPKDQSFVTIFRKFTLLRQLLFLYLSYLYVMNLCVNKPLHGGVRL